MAPEQFRFDNGAAYERHMGTWSRLAGDIFLDWLAPKPGLHWIDIGCGNGAFSERIVERCAPAAYKGSILRKDSSHSRARGQLHGSRNSGKATPWRCRSQMQVSTPP